ncbi:putative MFS family arabinose efflux permease [Actinoalloteichus hoggarensis]|uniref:Inner membrane transport protein YnfM n=1 Tax=Actinoalloteichus hoggarensis TaxID=1470176 RepID=A0A221W6Z9_9PSEU|nr:MFS transporter [Actinoalloteichus hoggarensis]ASO21750.1 Inner membrane transport protein YnfM [Actinoalloteichus hoggarensis]MBB5922347.1 putative MFS family arabinose efflux permease [Actinoalloteichus hoggarensis]
MADDRRARPPGTGAATAAPPIPMLWLLTVICGVTVGNLYYLQPLLDTIGREFDAGVSEAGSSLSAMHVGYALGLLLLLPLADVLRRRRLVVVLTVLTAAGLVAMTLAPGLAVLTVAATAVGVTTVLVQVLVAYVAVLSGERRGRVVGTLMTGMLTGVLLSRTVSGLLADLAGWRMVFAVAAVLMLLSGLALHRALPDRPADSTVGYLRLLGSLRKLVATEPVLRRRSLYGALCYGAFNAIWTSAAFLTAGPPYHWSETGIGLLGLAGLGGVLAAARVGRLADRGLQAPATISLLVLTLASFGLVYAGGGHVVPLLLGIVLMDFGIQGVHLLNQSEVYRLAAQAPARLTTVYMTSYFVGGSAGTALGALAFQHGGWLGACAVAAAMIAVAVTVWVVDRFRSSGAGKKAARPGPTRGDATDPAAAARPPIGSSAPSTTGATATGATATGPTATRRTAVDPTAVSPTAVDPTAATTPAAPPRRAPGAGAVGSH